MNTLPLEELIVGRGFDRYQTGLRSRFSSFRITYTLTYCEPTTNPGMLLDFESALHIGRVTVWASGACHMEALDVATGEVAFSEHHQLTSEDELFRVYPRLPMFMRDAMG